MDSDGRWKQGGKEGSKGKSNGGSKRKSNGGKRQGNGDRRSTDKCDRENKGRTQNRSKASAFRSRRSIEGDEGVEHRRAGRDGELAEVWTGRGRDERCQTDGKGKGKGNGEKASMEAKEDLSDG